MNETLIKKIIKKTRERTDILRGRERVFKIDTFATELHIKQLEVNHF